MTQLSLEQVMAVAIEHHRAGRLAQAETIYRQVLAREPRHAEALHHLGVIAGQLGRPEVAVELIGKATAINPECPDAYNNLGNVLQACGQIEEAIFAFREAIRLRPEYPAAYSNLGLALEAGGQIDEAVASCREAVRLDPQDARSHNNLGHCLREQGLIDLALDCYRKATALNPAAAGFHSNVVYTVCFHPGYDAQRILAEARRWDECHAQPLKPSIPAHQNVPSTGRRLRIGYVSPDFRWHVVGCNLLPCIVQHDPESFEIFCYANVSRPDAVTDRFRSRAGQWRNLVGVSDERAAEMIRADRIDILVDLTLHSAENRLLTFARKPAPVQVSYLGYCGTTGLEAMDYRLSDRYLDPLESDLTCYSEETVRLPRSYWYYEPMGPTPELSSASIGRDGMITFGCLNRPPKLSSDALDLWLEILRAVPRSRLLLTAASNFFRREITQRFTRANIPSSRLEFVGIQPWDDYVRTWQRIDIALDPFPYGGGITTCDALWMGVPVVTLSGRTAVGRGARSILSNLGLPELVAESPPQYLEIAASLGANLPRLSELRKSLRARMQSSPLRDAQGFVRDLEAAYREMWCKWCQKMALECS